MIVAFSIAPSGGNAVDEDGTMTDAVAAAVAVVRASGLDHQTSAMFTYLEGEWDEVFAVVKDATDAVLAVAPRVSLVLKADIRPGATGELAAKVDRIEQALR
ncbi:thiamine-binding protein [Williamsia sp. CHRR-6]|uniref:thiamine-binding protein n=1 Tax=Williamsia sp. CHRR-6 TaxID=2835871 RepID=UPI001BD93545|nr:thiamine-binding protein [Williamsia sp. CHRR-6]MBT0568237.1 thiamine-binding protein [Williamsia sp. CHRR-6]